MRKASAIWTITILGFMICCGSAAHAQDSALAKSAAETKPSPAAADRPVHAYRLDFSVNELEDGKKINSRQYSLKLNTNDSNEIKIGTRVPVETKEGEFQYLDVGTNIWAQIREQKGQMELVVRAEVSNFAIPEQGDKRDPHPALRQLKISGSTLLP